MIFYSKLVGIMLVVVLSLPVGLVLHEGSHLFVMALCNGTLEELSFGTQSFVGGYIAPEYISVIAMASIMIPLVLSVILSMIRNIHILFFNTGIGISTVINIVLGLFATCFINDRTRETYDVALAFDSARFPVIIIVLSMVCFIIQIGCAIRQFKQCNRKIDEYFFG